MFKKNMHQFPQNMIERLMDFLHYSRLIFWDTEAKIEIEVRYSPTTISSTRQPQRQQPHCARLAQGYPHIVSLIMIGKTQGYILGTSQGNQMPIKRNTIAQTQTSEQGGVIRQGNSWQRPLAHNDRVYKFHCNMLSIAGPGSVTKGDQPPSLVKTPGHGPAGLRDTIHFSSKESLRNNHAPFKARRCQLVQPGCGGVAIDLLHACLS